MSTTKKFPNRCQTAVEVCAHFTPSPEACKLLQVDTPLGEYLDLLLNHKMYPDGIRFVAHALPHREAIWWGCLCLWSVYRPSLPDDRHAAALRAAVRWVETPSEENRLAAQAPAQAVGLSAPAGGIAMAAFWSAGSMTPPDLPPVAPPPFLSSKTLAGALLGASAVGGPAGIPSRQLHFLELATDVSRGSTCWELHAPPSRWQGE